MVHSGEQWSVHGALHGTRHGAAWGVLCDFHDAKRGMVVSMVVHVVDSMDRNVRRHLGLSGTCVSRWDMCVSLGPSCWMENRGYIFNSFFWPGGVTYRPRAHVHVHVALPRGWTAKGDGQKRIPLLMYARQWPLPISQVFHNILGADGGSKATATSITPGFSNWAAFRDVLWDLSMPENGQKMVFLFRRNVVAVTLGFPCRNREREPLVTQRMVSLHALRTDGFALWILTLLHHFWPQARTQWGARHPVHRFPLNFSSSCNWAPLGLLEWGNRAF